MWFHKEKWLETLKFWTSLNSLFKWKVKNKIPSLFFQKWKWNWNGMRLRTRSEKEKKISRILEKRESRWSLGGSPPIKATLGWDILSPNPMALFRRHFYPISSSGNWILWTQDYSFCVDCNFHLSSKEHKKTIIKKVLALFSDPFPLYSSTIPPWWWIGRVQLNVFYNVIINFHYFFATSP